MKTLLYFIRFYLLKKTGDTTPKHTKCIKKNTSECHKITALGRKIVLKGNLKTLNIMFKIWHSTMNINVAAGKEFQQKHWCNNRINRKRIWYKHWRKVRIYICINIKHFSVYILFRRFKFLLNTSCGKILLTSRINNGG